MTRSIIGRAAVVLVAAAAGLTACRSDPPAPVTHTLDRVADVASLQLPPAITIDAAYRLPAGMRVAHYGAHTDGHYLVFGIEPPAGADGTPATLTNPGVQRSDQPGHYAIVSTSDGRLTVRDAGVAGALTDYMTIVNADGSHLVRVEPVARPAAECPDIPVTCYRWRITDEVLPDGEPRVIATGDALTAANEVPQPLTADGTVYWTVVTDHRAQVWAYRPGGEPHRVGTPAANGIFSVAGGAAWLGTPPEETAIRKIPADGGAMTRIALPPTAGLATVAGGRVAFRVDDGDARDVCVAELADPHSCRTVFRAPDVYALYWLGDSALIVSAPGGYTLVKLDGTATPLPMSYLYLVHSDSSRLSFVADADADQAIVVAHLA